MPKSVADLQFFLPLDVPKGPLPGMWLAIEGPDGSGKSTQATTLSLALKERFPHTEVVLTREPGGFCNGNAELIRTTLLNLEAEFDITTQMLLFMAARYEHLKYTVLPALAKGSIVICDRFIGSTFVYQGFLPVAQKFTEVDFNWDDSPSFIYSHLNDNFGFISSLHNMLFRGILPHFTFVLNADEHTLAQRIAYRHSQITRFEENLPQLVLGYKWFVRYLESLNKPVLEFDASKAIDVVHKELFDTVVRMREGQ